MKTGLGKANTYLDKIKAYLEMMKAYLDKIKPISTPGNVLKTSIHLLQENWSSERNTNYLARLH